MNIMRGKSSETARGLNRLLLLSRKKSLNGHFAVDNTICCRAPRFPCCRRFPSQLAASDASPPACLNCCLDDSDPRSHPVLLLSSSSGWSVWTEGKWGLSHYRPPPPGRLPNWSEFGSSGLELETVSCRLSGRIWLPASTSRRPLRQLESFSL